MKYDEFMNMNENNFENTNENENKKSIKRGQIYRVSQHSKKPYSMCLVIQNDKGNANSPYTIIAEVTTAEKKWLPTHVVLGDTKYKHLEVLTENIFTILQNDLGILVGECNEEEMEKVDAALAISIGLNQPQALKEIETLEKQEPIEKEVFVYDEQTKETREYIEELYSAVKELEYSIEKFNSANDNFYLQIGEVEAFDNLGLNQLETIKQITLGSMEQSVANNRIFLSIAMDRTFQKENTENVVENTVIEEKEQKAYSPIKQPKKEPMDMKLVMELKDSGWTNPQIAKELGKTVNAVTVAICNHRKKIGEQRKQLDMGKVMALKNAGWKNQEIADELGKTAAYIAVSISRYKQKQQMVKEIMADGCISINAQSAERPSGVSVNEVD